MIGLVSNVAEIGAAMGGDDGAVRSCDGGRARFEITLLKPAVSWSIIGSMRLAGTARCGDLPRSLRSAIG